MVTYCSYMERNLRGTLKVRIAITGRLSKSLREGFNIKYLPHNSLSLPFGTLPSLETYSVDVVF